MEEKDIEKQLKEEAAKLQQKDFAERWKVIKDRISPSVEGIRGEVLSEQKVSVTTSGSHTESRELKKKIMLFSGLAALLIAVCLAIVLPIALHKPQQRFLGLADLERKNVTESEFNAAIKSSGFQIIDLSHYELDTLYILVSDDEKVMGGKADVLDSETGSFIKLTFYSSNVKSEFVIGENFQTYSVDNVKIKYETSAENDYYTTVAIADSGSVIYELNCMTGDENVIAVFERLFG